MKQVPQNEMDVLLRKWGQADRTGSSEVPSSHLDPDELSAYAENVLPLAARAKYTEHLIDCTTCRGIVADLAQSVAVVSKKEEAKPSPIRQFFSNLIGPSFLRFAVPSLAAVLILAMGFFVFNRQSRMQPATEMVAKNESQPTAATSQPAAETKDPGQPATSSQPGTVQNAQSASSTEKAPAKTTTAVARPEGTPASPGVDEVRAQEETQKRTEAARADSARQAAAEPPAPQATSSAAFGERELAKSKVAENKKQPVAEARPIKEEGRKSDDSDAAANAPKAQPAPQARRSRVPAPAGMTGSVAGGAAGRDNQVKDKNESTESNETRRVAGRNFRKVNGVWTDTAYDGRETTNLSRGSEQFRALIADEPDFRPIAEQLDGQIVVVWKGRAYRIR